MSKDKHRSHQRRLALLHKMAYTNSGYPREELGIPIHTEGGIALKNPDLQRLIKDGLVVIERKPNWPGLKVKKTFARMKDK